MGYLAAFVIIVVVGTSAIAYHHVSKELRPTERPTRMQMRRQARRAARRVSAGDSCPCGGTVGRTGKISKRFGELLGCTACTRLWTLDGRRLRRRRPAYATQAPE